MASMQGMRQMSIIVIIENSYSYHIIFKNRALFKEAFNIIPITKTRHSFFKLIYDLLSHNLFILIDLLYKSGNIFTGTSDRKLFFSGSLNRKFNSFHPPFHIKAMVSI